MSIEQSNVVDIISLDPTDCVVLTISDHLEWNSESDLRHMWLLQEKVNKYLAFLESGEIYHSYPQYRGQRVKISVTGKFPLNSEAETFYRKVSTIVEGAGFEFQFKLYVQIKEMDS
jgi:hypothetical protein